MIEEIWPRSRGAAVMDPSHLLQNVIPDVPHLSSKSRGKMNNGLNRIISLCARGHRGAIGTFWVVLSGAGYAGPLLRDGCVLRSIAASSPLSVYSSDVGRQVGWSTVFVMQYVGPLLIYLVFYFRLASVYDDIKRHPHQVVHLACFCHSLHHIKHLLETLFVHKLPDGYTPIGNMLKGCAFYWGFTSWLGYCVNHPSYTPPYDSIKPVIPSLLWFLICELGNLCINISLVQHKQTANGVTYARPTYNPFTWLFKMVHCPQYTYEIGAWLSLSIMTQTVPVAVFAALVTTQMLLWARKTSGGLQSSLSSSDRPPHTERPHNQKQTAGEFAPGAENVKSIYIKSHNSH